MCIGVLYSLDSNLDTMFTYLHDGDAACLKSRIEGNGATCCGSRGEQCACGGVGCHFGVCGKSAEGDGATQRADEHGL